MAAALRKNRSRPARFSSSLNSSANPAALGSVVSVYATGAGVPAFAFQIDGQAAPGADDFHCCQVTAMGTPATVLYAGAAPGLVNGVVQINFRLPVFEFFAAQAYLDTALFEQHGITVEWQSYKHPVYPQLHGAFVPYLSVVDLLFNCGDESAAILAQGGKD